MSYSRLAPGLVLLVACFPAFAQTPADIPAPPASSRFYVGLAAYHSTFQNLGRWQRGNAGFRVPVQLMAGYQLRPRLALELGAAYSGATEHYASSGRYYIPTNPSGTYYDYRETSTVRKTSVSARARYTLTRNPAHRLQFDVLGGFTLERLTSSAHGTETDSIGGAFVTQAYSSLYSINTLLATAGVGARYRLAPRFELSYDLGISKDLVSDEPYSHAQGLTTSHALGLRYRFGR
ncbi:outer membrane beta-barrel protein [Hymenobacter daeguensis]